MMDLLNTIAPELFAMGLGVAIFLLAMAFLDWLIPHNVGVKRVGGITFIRWDGGRSATAKGRGTRHEGFGCYQARK